MARLGCKTSGYNPPKKLKIGSPDYSGFTKEKWIHSIMNWIEFVRIDSQKGWFSQKVSAHNRQLRYAEKILDLVLKDQYQRIVRMIEQTVETSVSGGFANSVLLPLGKQAKGHTEQQLRGDLRNTPVQFPENDSQMCVIL